MTVFSVQRFLEDHFERRGLSDIDQYAVRVANAFEGARSSATDETLAAALGRLRTAFFRRNPELNRKQFELQLSATLRRRFKKKTSDVLPETFERVLATVRTRPRARRRSIDALLFEFKAVVESRALDAFWDSRTGLRLRSRPEKIAQGLLAVFAKAVLGSDGLVLREFASGIGFVDVGIAFGRALHLVELKMLRSRLTGPNQLAAYMRNERRRTGWLLLIDVRRGDNLQSIPDAINTRDGRIRTVTITANPEAPHKM